MKHFNALTTEQFVERARAKHGPFYDYSKTEYVRNSDKVKIICPTHGMFQQKPGNHLTGNGCPICGAVAMGRTFVIGKEGYLKLFKQAHAQRYGYEKIPVEFKGRQKIEITCFVHGGFLKSASEHANGVGCPKCGAKLRASNSAGWTRTKWIEKQGQRTAKLYVVQLKRGAEAFYKIGITYRTAAMRLRQVPYKITVLETFESADAGAVYDLERALKNEFKSIKYQPLIAFEGQTECYSEADCILKSVAERWPTIAL